MTTVRPTSIEDRLGFFIAAQLHGYPLLFAADANGERARSATNRRKHHVASLVGARLRRRHDGAAELEPCAC